MHRNLVTAHARVMILVCTAVAVLAPRASSAACLTGHPSVAEEYRTSRYVVIGQKISNRPIGPSADGYFLRGNRSTVRIGQIFKGNPPHNLSIFSEDSSGRFPMSDGESYLLFVYQDHDRFLIDNCGNSAPLDQAARLIPMLKLIKPQK